MDYLSESDIQREYDYSVPKGKSFSITFYVGSRRFMYYKQYDLLRYNKGDVIPDNFKYQTDEEAWNAYNATLEKMPLLYQRSSLKVTSPHENGNMFFTPYQCD